MIFSPASNGPGQSRIPGGRALQADSKSSNTFQGGEGVVHVHCLWTSLIPHREEWDSLSERPGVVGQGGTRVNGVTGDPLTPCSEESLGAGGGQEKKEQVSGLGVGETEDEGTDPGQSELKVN